VETTLQNEAKPPATAAQSALFSLSERLCSLIALFGTMAILGRLLTPEDFGLFAIVASVQALFLPLLDLGLMPAFVKIPDVDEITSNVFFTLNLYCGVVNALLLLAVSPILWLIYGDLVLVPLCFVFLAAVIVESLSKQRLAIATRNRRFDLMMTANLAGLLTASAVAIALAYADWGVWSLAIRVIIRALILYLAYRLLVPRRFRVAGLSEIRQFRREIRFAASIVVGRLMGGVYQSMDKLFFGAIFGNMQLGLYSKASQLDAMPDNTIRAALSTPAYSHIVRHGDEERLARYLPLSNILFLVAGTPCLLLIVIGDQLIVLLMGPQWSSAGIYVQLLGLWGIGQIMHGIGAVVHMADGEMRSWIRAHVLATVLLACLACLAGWAWGAIGFVLGIGCANLVFWTYVLLRWLYGCAGSIQACLALARTIAISFLAVLSTGFLVRAQLDNVAWPAVWISQVVSVGAVAAFGCLAMLLLHRIFNRRQFDDLFRLVRSHLGYC